MEALADLLLEAMEVNRTAKTGGADEPKVTSDHLGRVAVVYVRQSTMAQVTGNLESQRRQYDLAAAATAAALHRLP